jgi:hypothetical protein
MMAQRRSVLGISLLASTALLLLGTPAGNAWANDGHVTKTNAMPGGAGSVTCTTDYNFNASRTSIYPLNTYCKNNTNRYLTTSSEGSGWYCNYRKLGSFNVISHNIAPGRTWHMGETSNNTWCSRSYTSWIMLKVTWRGQYTDVYMVMP